MRRQLARHPRSAKEIASRGREAADSGLARFESPLEILHDKVIERERDRRAEQDRGDAAALPTHPRAP